MDAIVAREYRECKTRRDITVAVRYLMRRFGLTRGAIGNRASGLGIAFGVAKRPWTREEEEQVERWSGTASVKNIARRLNRATGSVVCKMQRMGISTRVSDGIYTVKLLADLFGVSWYTVDAWEKRGMIRRSDRYFRESNVREFAANYPDQYDLRRVDQVWFKYTMFKPKTVGEILRSTNQDISLRSATQ